MTGKLEIQKRVHPLKEVPEQIGDKIGVAPETFFNFLAQNYLSFFSSLDDVVTASSALADAAAIFSCWVLDDLAGTSRNFKVRLDERLLCSQGAILSQYFLCCRNFRTGMQERSLASALLYVDSCLQIGLQSVLLGNL